MNWHEFRGWLISATIGALGLLAVKSLDKIEASVQAMNQSVQELNIKLGTVMAVQSSEAEKTKDHEYRLRVLEGKK